MSAANCLSLVAAEVTSECSCGCILIHGIRRGQLDLLYYRLLADGVIDLKLIKVFPDLARP